MKKISLYLVVLLISSCYNPFFPETGTPSSGSRVSLDSPYNTISALEECYENKDIAFFRDSLLLKNSPVNSTDQFRYYIQYKNSAELSLENISKIVDLDRDYIPKGEYLYIEYSSEVNLHRNLFDSKNEIVFLEPLSISKIDYVFKDESKTDTTEAFVHTSDNSIRISSSVILQNYGVRDIEFDVTEQIFHIYKGSDNQWRIFEWFELN